MYVTGWIKRGSRGVIGTNRSCAEESVASLWADFDRGLLDRELDEPDALAGLLVERGVERVDWQGWLAIDEAERRRGEQAGRPRIKFVDLAEMLGVATTAESTNARQDA